MTNNFEREFLSLASTYLVCRYKAMGGLVAADTDSCTNLRWYLLGMHDYASEMELLVREQRETKSRMNVRSVHPAQCLNLIHDHPTSNFGN